MLAVLILTAVIGLFVFWYLIYSVHSTFPAEEGSTKSRIFRWLLAAVPALALAVYCRFHLVTGLIVAVHLAVFRLLCGFAVRLLGKRFGKREISGQDRKRGMARAAGALAVVITTGYLAAGWYFAHHVAVTRYQLQTEKNIGADPLRIVQISDSHIGSTFDGEGFARHMKTVQELEPDVVVITGDYVDDDSLRVDMERCGEALGSLKTTYGVYYVYGNHDRGYFQYRDFSWQDMEENLEKNGVRILKDEAVMLEENVCLIGREDRSVPGRMNMAELMEEAKKLTGTDSGDLYTIVLDHQPCDFDAQAAAGVDLVLCGHTHGGHMFPGGITGELSGAYDKNYGLEVRDNTTFIVNSGISGWTIPFKTGAASEIGVIEVSQRDVHR